MVIDLMRRLVGMLLIVLGIALMIPGLGDMVTIVLTPSRFLKMFFRSMTIKMTAGTFLICVGAGLLML